MKSILSSLCLLSLVACSDYLEQAKSPPSPDIVESLDFNRDVRPILSDKCFYCHGPDAENRKAGLRLDEPSGAYARLKDSETDFAIVPGKPENSEFWKRICSDDEDELMPPRKSNKTLSAAEKAVLKRWITEGAKYEGHWAFQSVKSPSVPKVSSSSPGNNEIDRFVQTRLKKEGLQISPEADRATLLRRLSLDLIGLPPTREELKTFLADRNPGAYERQVERLLASQRYGEHMAMGWMDIARYSDTDGFQYDRTRTMWPWRDWVVRAYNQDFPYDQFVRWQIAGDLLPGATQEQILASGFNRNHMLNNEGGRNPEPNRVDYVIDRTVTTGTAFLGLTLDCSRCHDHKFDPITAKDFYSLSAYFNQVDETGAVLSWGPTAKVKGGRWGDQEVLVMKDLPVEKQRKTWVLLRGEMTQHGEEVQAGVPPAIRPVLPPEAPKNRLALADWLASAENPLVARVEVNRQWQRFFGKGLVLTSEDFGLQSQYPSHPELLDWLAARFVKDGWSIKSLQRLIVLSSTYRQGSKASPELLNKDPENRLLARQSRFRLPAATLRDQALLASGLLNGEIGGPGVNPYQPAGMWEEVTNNQVHFKQDHAPAIYRRSLYVFWRRLCAPASLFDVSKRQVCQVRPIRTNTPLQSLALFNDPAFFECARVLAQNSLSQATESSARLGWAFETIIGRPASQADLAPHLDAYDKLLAIYRQHPAEAAKLLKIGEAPTPKDADPVVLAALACTCNVMLSLDETISRE
ncbi:MAG: hypothetical protein RL095_3249 [Verrucomicrobiota bacterium]